MKAASRVMWALLLAALLAVALAACGGGSGGGGGGGGGETPKIQVDALSTTTAAPASPLTITGSGFDPEAEIWVNFSDGQGFNVNSPVVFEAGSSSLTVTVPPFFNFSTYEFGPGTVSVRVLQGSLVSNVVSGFQIKALPQVASPTGYNTIAYLDSIIQLLEDTKYHIGLLGIHSGNHYSNPDLIDILDELVVEYGAVRDDVESLIADPELSVKFAQVAGEELSLNSATLVAIDKLVAPFFPTVGTTSGFGAYVIAQSENDGTCRFDGITVVDAKACAQTRVGYAMSTVSLARNIEKKVFEGKSEILKKPASVATIWNLFIVAPAVWELKEDITVAAALSGKSAWDEVMPATKRWLNKYDSVFLDMILPFFGTALDKIADLFDLPGHEDTLRGLAAESFVPGLVAVPPYDPGRPLADFSGLDLIIWSPIIDETNFTLTTTKAGTGGGAVSASPPGPVYVAGTVVTLAATPNTGSIFAGWSGACSGTGSCVVTMNSDQAVTATFTLGFCGDGMCDSSLGESTATCPQDCPPPDGFCGDGVCDADETSDTCPGDCPPPLDDSCCACVFDVYCTAFGPGGCWYCENSTYSGGVCQAPYGYLTYEGACDCDSGLYQVCL